jgi:hypothetical protein
MDDARSRRRRTGRRSLTRLQAGTSAKRALLLARRRYDGQTGLVESKLGYRVGPKASAIRASNSFFTSCFGSGLSTGKCSEPLVFVYPSVSLASCGITEPLCGR